MSAGGDSGEGSTPARGPRPYEWHLMQAMMPRHFEPFDPAMFSRNAAGKYIRCPNYSGLPGRASK
jgi:hypothetical protein